MVPSQCWEDLQIEKKRKVNNLSYSRREKQLQLNFEKDVKF